MDQVAPHGFLELRDFIRQFLQRGDEPLELPAPDALLPYLSRHPVAFFLCRLVNGNQGVVLRAVIILILSDPGVRGNEVLDGVGIVVQPLIQFLQRFFQFIRAAVSRLDFPEVGDDRLPVGGEFICRADERIPDLILRQVRGPALMPLVLVLGVAAPDDFAVTVCAVPDL